jgi:hypothetical protein
VARLTDVDVAPADGLAVRLRLVDVVQDTADDQRPADVAAVHRLLLQTHADEVGSDLLAGRAFGDVRVLAEPTERDAHQSSTP